MAPRRGAANIVEGLSSKHFHKHLANLTGLGPEDLESCSAAPGIWSPAAEGNGRTLRVVFTQLLVCTIQHSIERVTGAILFWLRSRA